MHAWSVIAPGGTQTWRVRESDRLAKNKDKIRSRLAAKRAADPQKHRGYMRRWRAANRDRINKRRAAQRKAARDYSD
jgi:hypothetical protein